ncbi:MAG TPA: HAMP domain-containing sensor histidine kinase [Kofleriaceae bacterium]
MRSWRAWIYVLSFVALFAPAAGIAYLGAVSYRDERGAVSAQAERQREVAQAIADRVSGEIQTALDQLDAFVAKQPGPWESPQSPLTRYWFWIDADHKLRHPRPAPPSDAAGEVEVASPCSGRLEDCAREVQRRTTRLLQLRAGERAEAAGSWLEARRAYAGLVGDANVGPAALLGLARVLGAMRDPHADAPLAELEARYADRAIDGVSVKLLVAVLRAQAAADPAGALLDVADRVLSDDYALDAVVRFGALLHVRALLDAYPASPRRDSLDRHISEIQPDARAAASLAADLPEIERTAGPQWRGISAARQPARTIVFRKRTDGGIIGISADALMLEGAAGEVPASVARGAHALVRSVGTPVSSELRTIQEVPVSPALPHLRLAVVNPVTEPDPLDQVLQERARRHVVLTSALAIALGLGALLTIRGAVRARELARLKSDFVSTVSHELKTPLTSIRMFAEMLQQGVAQGDETKMSRYHGVIVQESQRLGLLIANLLDYAQIEKGTRRYSASRLGAPDLARLAVSTFEALRDPEKGGRNPIEIAVSPAAVAAELDTDRDVLVGAILNLLANAAKYGGADRPIEVAVDADAAAAWIAVRDHGPGIPATEQPRIFREFYRSPEAYRSGVEGTGLGLALVKRHVEALGGTVEVASVVGAGATFTIRLPRAAEVSAW